MTEREARERWERLGRLLEPVHEIAVGVARHLCRSPGDGDDLYHDAVLRAFDKVHTLRDESRFRSWFFAVLFSVHRSRCRRAFWRRFLPLDDHAEHAERAGKDGFVLEEERLGARRAALALARLSPVQREALVLHAIEGFSVEEIAALQGASVPAVKSRVLRARERVRETYRRRGWVTSTLPLERERRDPSGLAFASAEALASAGSSPPERTPTRGGGHARRS